MRLCLSVAVLLIITCVVIEISAAKSNRDADTTKSNHKSGNSKEVRYSKHKSDVKKKGNGKRQEVVKEKKQHHNVEGTVEKIDSNDVLKDNQNERNGKVFHEEEKNQKSNKPNKTGKNSKNFENNKNIKVTKETGKKHKRSLEFEQPKDSSTNQATDISSKNEESQLNSASKNIGKNKFVKKSEKGNRIALVDEPESDAIVNIEGVPDNQPSKESASSADKHAKISRKYENAEKHQGNSKKIKKQKHNHKSEELREENMDLKDTDSTKEKIQTSDEPTELKKNSGSLNDLPEDSSDWNRDALAKEEKAGSLSLKKQKSSKKTSKAGLQCERKGKDCKVPCNLDKHKPITQKSEKYKSGSCKLEAQGLMTDQNRTHVEKSEDIADDCTRSSIVDTEQQEANNKAPKNERLELTEENEAQDDTLYGLEAEDCIRVDSVQENVMQESCSME